MKLAESRINELRQQVANLQSPEPEKVRAAYEALTVNARENAKALLAVLDAQTPPDSPAKTLSLLNDEVKLVRDILFRTGTLVGEYMVLAAKTNWKPGKKYHEKAMSVLESSARYFEYVDAHSAD